MKTKTTINDVKKRSGRRRRCRGTEGRKKRIHLALHHRMSQAFGALCVMHAFYSVWRDNKPGIEWEPFYCRRRCRSWCYLFIHVLLSMLKSMTKMTLCVLCCVVWKVFFAFVYFNLEEEEETNFFLCTLKWLGFFKCCCRRFIYHLCVRNKSNSQLTSSFFQHNLFYLCKYSKFIQTKKKTNALKNIFISNV